MPFFSFEKIKKKFNRKKTVCQNKRKMKEKIKTSEKMYHIQIQRKTKILELQT